MSEGEVHARLVLAMVKAIRREFPDEDLQIAADLVQTRELLSPITMGGVRPDVLATVARTVRHTILGEAKSRKDVDTAHTREQLKQYFEYLAWEPDGRLWLSVPLTNAGEGLRVVRAARRDARCERVPAVVSGWLLGAADIETRWHV